MRTLFITDTEAAERSTKEKLQKLKSTATSPNSTPLTHPYYVSRSDFRELRQMLALGGNDRKKKEICQPGKELNTKASGNSYTPSPRSVTLSTRVFHSCVLCIMGLMSLFQGFHHSLKSSAEPVTRAHFCPYTVICTQKQCSSQSCPSTFRLLLLTFGRSSTGGFNKTGHFRNHSVCLRMVLLGLCL